MPSHKVSHHEVDDAIRIALRLVLEIETFVHLLDSYGLLVSGMSQNKLLEEEEGALVGHALPHLDLSLPGMWSVRNLTVVTLEVLYNKFDLEALLQESVCLHLFLNG